MSDRQGQWFGDTVLKTIETTSLSEVIQLMPTAASLQNARDVVCERVIISFQTRRIDAAAIVEGYAYEVWKGRFLVGTNTPAQAKDPLDVGATSQFSKADANIMHTGPLEVPESILNGFTGAQALNGRVTAEQVEVPVKRSVNRANEGILLAVVADNSFKLKCLVSWRLYYTYS